jgi:symplekin
MHLLQLATKQIWNDTTQWKGWLMCAQQTVPDSFPALVSLPADVLGTVAKAMPETTKQQMLQFVRQGSVTVPSAITAVLEAVQTEAA